MKYDRDLANPLLQIDPYSIHIRSKEQRPAHKSIRANAFKVPSTQRNTASGCVLM